MVITPELTQILFVYFFFNKPVLVFVPCMSVSFAEWFWYLLVKAVAPVLPSESTPCAALCLTESLGAEPAHGLPCPGGPQTSVEEGS